MAATKTFVPSTKTWFTPYHITPYNKPVFFATHPGCVMVTNVPIWKKQWFESFFTNICETYFGGLSVGYNKFGQRQAFNVMVKSHSKTPNDPELKMRDNESCVIFIQLKNNLMHWSFIETFDNRFKGIIFKLKFSFIFEI